MEGSDEWQVKTKRRGGRGGRGRGSQGEAEAEEPKRRWVPKDEHLPPPRYQATSGGFASELQRGTTARTVTQAEADAAVKLLAECGERTFFVARLFVPAVPRPGAPSNVQLPDTVQSRILPHVEASKFRAEGIVIGRTVEKDDAIWLGVLTWEEPEAAMDKILQHCKASFQEFHDRGVRRPDAWRFVNARVFATWNRNATDPTTEEPYFEGEPLALEMVNGPHTYIPDDVEGDEEVRSCCHRFAVPDGEVDLKEVTCSKEVTDLLRLVRSCCHTVFATNARNITPMHLAALSGNVTVAKAAAQCAPSFSSPNGWCDKHGRTPLHYTAFFDNPGLVRALWGFGDPGAKDRWGKTAWDLAFGLGHRATAAALSQDPQPLQRLCEQRVLRLLRGTQAEVATALSKMESLPSGLSLRSCVPLHEHAALKRLAQAVPGEVEPTELLRSMSCMECWYADLLNCGCGPAVPGCLELHALWNEPMDSVQGGEAEPDDDGALLVRSPARQKVSPLADRKTFIERFHRRTGGVLAGMDWSNVMVIGGMVLACLTATDEEYARDYRETDVDIYVVGLSGEAFRQRVAEVVSALPRTEGEGDYFYRLDDDYILPVKRDAMGLLVVGEAQCRKGKGKGKSRGTGICDRERAPRLGDMIIEVDSECRPEAMERELEKRCKYPYGPGFQPHILKVRTREGVAAAGREPSSTLLRTPQTLTAVVRSAHGKPLPNVQVVLAPYSSPAHLLFTTDIDCVAIGFDGKHLLATPRGREALRRRRNVVRPEKYAVRGEWRTETRLLKYASRGFRVVDIGVKSNAKAPPCPTATAAAAEAEPLLKKKEPVEAMVRKVCDSGVHGARLLMLARHDVCMLSLMLHEEPLLKAGTERDTLVSLVRNRRVHHRHNDDDEAASGSDDDEPEARGRPKVNRAGKLEMDDGYGRGVFQLLMVNPSRLRGMRIGDGRLRGLEVHLQGAIAELDLEADKFEVRSWYEGLRDEDLLPQATLDPQVWRGIGDFRAAP